MMVWDISSGELIYNLHSPNEDELLEGIYESSLVLLESEWSHDGRYLVVGASYEGYGANSDFYSGKWLLWWDMDTGEQAGYRPWNTPATGNDKESAHDRLSLHPEQNILAASSHGDVLFLDLETGQPIEMSPGIGGELNITGVSLPQQGDRFLTASHEVYNEPPNWLSPSDTLRVWDLETGENTGTFTRPDLGPETYDSLLEDFEWSPSGSEFAAAFNDWQVLVWDAQTGAKRLSLEGAGSNLIWFPDGQKLITYSMLAIKVWDSAAGQLLNDIETSRYIHAIDWSPDGSTIAAGTGSWRYDLDYERRVNMWDVVSGQLVQTVKIDDLDIYGPIRAVDYGVNSSRLAVGMGSLFGHGAFMTWGETPQNPLLSKRFTYDKNDPDDWDTVSVDRNKR